MKLSLAHPCDQHGGIGPGQECPQEHRQRPVKGVSPYDAAKHPKRAGYDPEALHRSSTAIARNGDIATSVRTMTRRRIIEPIPSQT